MIVALLTIVHYRGNLLVRGDPLQWGIFYSEWVLNVVERFLADDHHRGVLWRLPERVVDSIPLLGLEYILEGSSIFRCVSTKDQVENPRLGKKEKRRGQEG
jgi:hypothetical protein